MCMCPSFSVNKQEMPITKQRATWPNNIPPRIKYECAGTFSPTVQRPIQFNVLHLKLGFLLLLFCFSSGGGAPFHKTEIRSLDTTLQQFHLGWLPALGAATESHLEHPTDVKSSWRKLGLALQVRLLAAGYLAEIISRCGESLGRDSHYRSIHYFREASRCCLVVEKRW